MIWLTILFLMLAGIAKGYLDYYADSGIKDKQWPNKWENINEGWSKKDLRRYHWWYLGLYTPKWHRERFPLSSTILVFLTDKWHLAQLIMLRFMYLAIAINCTENIYIMLALSFLVFPIILGVPFEIIYRKNKNK
jgi:hypothetical protein